MFGLGWSELLVVLAIVLVIFGASRLPEIGRGLGSGIQEFRKSLKSDDKSGDESDAPKKELPEE